MKNTSAPDAQRIPNVDVKVYPVKEPDKLLAYASAAIGGCFAVNNIRIYNSEKGPFVAMPSRKGQDGQYHDICCPTTKEMREVLHSAILGAYQKEMERPSVRGALKDASKEAESRPSPAKAAKRITDKGER